MPCSPAVKLPPATTWLPAGLLCLCSCTLPFVLAEDPGLDAGTAASDDAAQTVAPTTGEASEADTGSDAEVGGGASETTDASETMTTAWPIDVGGEQQDEVCAAPPADCDDAEVDSDVLAHALGVNCGAGGVTSAEGLATSGHPDSLAVVGKLGAGETFAPRLGKRALLLSTGRTEHAQMSPEQLLDLVECSQIGLPCPSGEFDDTYDLAELPAPMLTAPSTCPEGQPGDCSQTIEAQWLGDPRLAHDYTELRLTTTVPLGSLEVAVQAAFFTAERPARLPYGDFNDLFVIWLESELFTGNIAIHPAQQRAMAVNELEYDHKGLDPALAGFGFAEHAAMDWTTFAAPVLGGESITLVMALFDVNDGGVDTAVLLDDLHWNCSPPTGGPPPS